jgi:PTS system nitrogen regulatory IIA component
LPGILGDTFIALGAVPRGIPFGGGTANLTDIFFLICSTDDRIHLRILTRLSRILSSGGFLQQLRDLSDAGSIRDLVENTETAML